MLAIVQERYGAPEVLVAREVDDPLPGPGQVRIRVAAAGVHLIDTTVRRGAYSGPIAPPELPTVPGREVAGTVDALGDGVPAELRGRRVSAHLGAAGSGGYAQLALADVEALHHLPDHVGEVDAVAVLGTGRMTMGLLELARPGPDDLALVTSSAGGIGTLLVQALTAGGTDVVAAAGTAERAERGRSLGAVAAVDYGDPDWGERLLEQTGGRHPTVVFDGVGGTVGRTGYDLLGPGGRIVVHGWSSGAAADLDPATGDGAGSAGNGDRRDERTVIAGVGPPIIELGLRRLADRALDAVADGTLVPQATRFPLAEAAEAHRALEERRTVGKVVLEPWA